MMILLRVFALVLLAVLILFGLWLVFVNLAGRENSMWFAGRPSKLGVKDGKLLGPRKTPNSVVSEGVESTHPAYAAPLAFTGDAQAAMAKLGAVLQALDRVTFVKVDDTYLHAEFRSKTLGYVDDFEARVDAAASVIHMRSASRMGYGDRGFNRARIEMIRAKFSAS
jgi:uncharacterized protein (DUF1499 family)